MDRASFCSNPGEGSSDGCHTPLSFPQNIHVHFIKTERQKATLTKLDSLSTDHDFDETSSPSLTGVYFKLMNMGSIYQKFSHLLSFVDPSFVLLEYIVVLANSFYLHCVN